MSSYGLQMPTSNPMRLNAMGIPDFSTMADYGIAPALPVNDLKLNAMSPAAPTSVAEFSWFDPTTWGGALQRSGALGSLDAKTGVKTDGWGGLALGTASGLANLYMGMKQYGLAKDQFDFQKNSFNKNWEANKNLTNASLEDRQARRITENPNATSVAEYMSKYGVK